MKKLVALLLCLSLVLLSGCQLRIFDDLKEMFQLDTIVPPTGTEEDYYKWNAFFWDCEQNREASFEMQRIKEDGETDMVTVTYDCSKYTITDNAGTRTYSHLIHDTNAEIIDDNYHYSDYFFLTDDPNMTFEKYQKAMSSPLNDHMQLLLPTELVLGKTGVADSVECYGLVPKAMENVLSCIYTGKTWEKFFETSFFTIEDRMDSAAKQNDTAAQKMQIIKRYDYDGRLLCSVTLPLPYASTFLELENGGFCVALTDYTQDIGNKIICFNAKGQQLWQYDFPDNRTISLWHMFQINDAIYCFGDLKAKENSGLGDIYFLKLSEDGTFVKEQIAGGSHNEYISFVEINQDGFTVYGQTGSTDGDFPFYAGTTSEEFRVQVSNDLELSGAEQYEHSIYNGPCGYYKSAPIHTNHPIFTPVEKDRLPEDTYNRAIIPFGSGYVILRSVRLEPYTFNPTYHSSQTYYIQIIATYYNAFGEPVWQTVGKPFIGL